VLINSLEDAAMYAFRDFKQAKYGSEYENKTVESGTVRAIPKPITLDADLSMPSSEIEPSGPQLRAPCNTEPMSAPEPATVRMVGGSRVVDFPAYTSAPPIGLATCVPRDPSATHIPTGDTSPPIVQIATAARSPSLEGLFSTTVMETLPGF
jgi:hypothetical protein